MSGAVAGIVLAAGGGSRFGGPKALASLDGETLPARAVRVLTEAGCRPVLVVLGAVAGRARAALPDDARPVLARGWAEGLGASLRAGLDAAATLDPPPAAVVLHLIDLPDVTPAVALRVLAGAGAGEDALARAVFRGVPGHPVVVGRAHWPALRASLHGDRGAGPWLRAQPAVREIECGDLATGADADTADALRRHGRVT